MATSKATTHKWTMQFQLLISLIVHCHVYVADDDNTIRLGPNSSRVYVFRSLIEPWKVPLCQRVILDPLSWTSDLDAPSSYLLPCHILLFFYCTDSLFLIPVYIVGMHTIPYYGYVCSVGRSFDGNGTPIHHSSTFVRGALNGDGAGLKTDVWWYSTVDSVSHIWITHSHCWFMYSIVKYYCSELVTNEKWGECLSGERDCKIRWWG